MRVAHGQVWSVTVVSTGQFNALPIRQAIVVPLTTRDRRFPHHITVTDDGGLNRPSWAMCEAVRAVSLERFGQLTGAANSVTLAAITDQLALWLGHHTSHLTPGHPLCLRTVLRHAR